MTNDGDLVLRLRAEGHALVWEVANVGSTPVRLWEQGNSWGWRMPRLHVSALDGDERLRLDPASKLWTRNFPSTVDVEPQASTRYVLTAGDFDPATLAAAADLADRLLRAEAELHCEPTPECEEFGVWCGSVRSEPVELQPPHGWLRA